MSTQRLPARSQRVPMLLVACSGIAAATFAPRVAIAQSDLDFEQMRFRPARTPVDSFTNVPGITDALDVAVGDHHACALLRDHSVRCWGANRDGQLGDGSARDQTSPVAVAGVIDAVQLVAGNAHNCVRNAAGSVMCWGANGYGQSSATHGAASVARAAAIPGLADVVDLASNGDSACAVLRDGTVRCWGANFAGQLGSGTRVDPFALVTVAGLRDATQIAMGGNATCARTRAGTVTCWGADDRGQLGIGPYVEQCAPARVIALHDVVSVAAGDYFGCALNARGFVQCWGEVGDDGTHGFTAAPVPIDFARGRPLDHVSTITARGRTACFVRRDASVACMDVVTGSPTRPVAQPVATLANATRIALRPPIRCIVRSDGHVACAGPSSERIQVPTPAPAPSPR